MAITPTDTGRCLACPYCLAANALDRAVCWRCGASLTAANTARDR